MADNDIERYMNVCYVKEFGSKTMYKQSHLWILFSKNIFDKKLIIKITVIKVKQTDLYKNVSLM